MNRNVHAPCVHCRRLLCFRLNHDGVDGKFLARLVINHMWNDVDARVKKLGVTLTILKARVNVSKQFVEKKGIV